MIRAKILNRRNQTQKEEQKISNHNSIRIDQAILTYIHNSTSILLPERLEEDIRELRTIKDETFKPFKDSEKLSKLINKINGVISNDSLRILNKAGERQTEEAYRNAIEVTKSLLNTISSFFDIVDYELKSRRKFMIEEAPSKCDEFHERQKQISEK